MNARITPLLLAQMGGIAPWVPAYGRPHAPTPQATPLFCHLVKDPELGPVLFDLGCYPDAVARERGRGPIRDHRSAAEAVQAHGVDPADIGTVVLSHLHWDHCVGVEEFPAARVLVQRSELRFAFAPDPEQWHPYDSWELGRRAPWRDHLDRIEPVDGALRLSKSLLLIPTPGHTPGSQSLRVHADRDYLLCGDLIVSYDSWPRRTWPGSSVPTRWPPGIHTDLAAWRASVDLIEREGWFPIPAHDLRVEAAVKGQWPPEVDRAPNVHQ